MRLNRDRANLSSTSNHTNNSSSYLTQQKEISKTLKERENREIKHKNDLWKSIIDATEFIKEKTIIHHDTMPLYDSFFKTEPNTFMSRAGFHDCLTKILNKRSNNKRESGNDASKLLVKKEITILCKALDAKNKNEIDWRMFLYILNISINLDRTFSEQLILGFRFFAIVCRNTDTSMTFTYKLNMKELPRLFFPLLQSEKLANTITKRFDEAWIKEIGTDNSMGLSTNLISGKTSYIIYQDFKSMLKQYVLLDYFEMVRFKGCLQTDIVMFTFERRFYPDILLDGVFRIRESIKVTQLMKEKVKKLDYLCKQYTVKRWKEYLAQCRKLRLLFDKCFQQYLDKMRVSFFGILMNSIRKIAIAELQRMSRGFLVRLKARNIRKRHYSATILQSLVRSRMERAAYSNVVLARNWAATEIQRHTRAYIARQVVMRRALSCTATERRKLLKEQLRWECHLKGVSVRIIQRLYRYKKAKTTTTEKYRKEIITKNAMEQAIEKFKQERKIYEMKILELNEAQRADWEKNHVVNELHSDNGKSRARQNQNKQIKTPKSGTKINNSKELKSLVINGREIIEKHCEEFPRYCNKCITLPDTPKERKFGMTIKKRIKLRKNYVLKRADLNKIPMETSEAYDIAKDEIIHIICEEEKMNKKKEIDTNIAAAKKRIEEELQQEQQLYESKKMNKTEAALMIGLASRRWLARKEIRQKFSEVYEKLFSEEYAAFYYKHKTTNATAWEKPKIFGRFDIPAKNQWKIMKDEQGFPYYFNPFSFKMTWEKPTGLRMCCEIITYHWWQIYPQPSGHCVNFATRWSVWKQNFYCEECWYANLYRKQETKDMNKLLFKRLNGKFEL